MLISAPLLCVSARLAQFSASRWQVYPIDVGILPHPLLHQVESGADLHREVEIVSVYLLDTLTRAVLTLESSSPVAGGGQRGRLVAALASLLRLMAPRHYCHLWDEVGDSEQLTHFLLRLMAVFRELVTEQVSTERGARCALNDFAFFLCII